MAINVIVGEQKTQKEKLFPKLMECIIGQNKGMIVFFYESGHGTVITKGVNYKPGRHLTVWHMPSFTDFNDPITLQND